MRCPHGIDRAPSQVLTTLAAEPCRKKRYLKLDEYQRVKAAAPEDLKLWIRLGVATGFRLQEALQLQAGDIDWSEGTINLSDKNKTDRPRTIPMNNTAREVLEEAGARFRPGYVFHNTQGNPFTTRTRLREASRRVSAFMDSIDLPDVTFMTLRHTAATWGWHGVRSWGLVSRYLGHSEGQSVTAGYVHLDWEVLKPIGDALDLFDSGVNPRTANQMATQDSNTHHARKAKAEVPVG